MRGGKSEKKLMAIFDSGLYFEYDARPCIRSGACYQRSK